MNEIKMLLDQYSILQSEYVEFKKNIENDLKKLLVKNEINFQQLTGRVKKRESLENKLKKNPNLLVTLKGDIKNLNDLCGIRIILYDNVNLNNVFQLIQKNYEIIESKSKRFDYNANNVTIKTNNGFFSDLRCEIQLVTVMSHNLIEIGHDIVYKNDELKAIDAKEMELINQDYNKCLEEVYKLETKIDNIKKRAENVKSNYSLYNKIISDEYLESIKNNDSSSFFYKCCNEIKSIIGYLSRNEKQIKEVNEKNIFKLLTENIPRLKEDGIYNKEYIFDNYNSVMAPYINIWIDDIDEILKVILSFLDSAKNDRMNKSFFGMIKNVVQYGIKDNNWFVFDKIKSYIISESEYSILRVKLVNAILDNNITYTETVDQNTINLVRKELFYTEEGKELIIDLFKYCCSLFLENQDNEIYDILIELTFKFVFLIDDLFSFFKENYSKINDFYKCDLVKKMYYQYKDKTIGSNYFKEIKKDTFYDIWKYLMYDHFDEEYDIKDWKEVEEKAKRIIEKYIRLINEKEILEIERILDCYEFLKTQKQRISYRLTNFIYMIGKKYSNALDLYEKYNNSYLYLGLREKKKVLKRTDTEILDALHNIYIESIFEEFIINKNQNLDNDVLICKIILDKKLYIEPEKKKTFFEIISFYNLSQQFIGINFISEEFMNNISSQECNVLLENFRYAIEKGKSFIGIDFMDIFSKFPQNIRNFIKRLIINDIKLNHRVEMYITSADNYKAERKNNLLLIIEILKEKEFFQIWQYATQLIEISDVNLISDLSEIISFDDSEENMKAISKLLLELEITTSEIWKIVREISIKTKNEETKKNLKYSLVKMKSATSLYEEYKIRKDTLNKIKKKEKDKEMKSILNDLAKYCSSMMSREKLREIKSNEERGLKFF